MARVTSAPDGDGAYVGVIEPDGDGAYVSVIEPEANAHRIAAQSKDVSAHIVDDAPHSAIPEGGSSEDTEDLSFEEDPQADKEMIDIEAWLAPLRPSPSDLAAGAATIASKELKEHERFLRYVGERSASKMMGEKMGAPPGTDPSTDAAWQFLADPARSPCFQRQAEAAGRAVPPERRADVTRWIAELLTTRGLRRLRALAQELWVHAGSPCVSETGQPIAVATVNWPACWAWCRRAFTPLMATRSPMRSVLTPACVHTLCLPSLRDCHIEAIPDSEVNIVGQLLFDLVSSLIRTKVVPSLPLICPLDLESDFHAAIGSKAWCSIHPCMHWCGYDGLMRWCTRPRGQNTCPVCRTVIQFMLVTENPRMTAPA
jgi:hypothetical protein